MAKHYSSEQKERVHNEIVAALVQRGHEPKRIFTLPSVDGFCAKRFRSKFPAATIIGLERDPDVVKGSILVERRHEGELVPMHVQSDVDQFGFPHICLDALYHGNTDALAGGLPRDQFGKIPKNLLKRIAFRSVKGGVPVPILVPETDPDFGNFDFLYLDFTCMLSSLTARNAPRFVESHAADRAIAVLTFAMFGHTREDALRLFPGAEFHSYRNANSDMCYIIWEFARDRS